MPRNSSPGIVQTEAMTPKKTNPVAQTLEARVIAAKSSLTRNDQLVLQFLLDHVDEIGVHTAESVSQGAGVSAAAVVRCAGKLGFSGFRELRDYARAQVFSSRGALSEEAENDGLMSQKIDSDVRNLSLLKAVVDDALLARAAGHVSEARRVWIVGNRETFGLALYMQRLLHDVRSNVHLVEPGFADPLRDLDSADVVLVATFRPYSRLSVDMLPMIRESGATLIVICDGTARRFLQEPDLVLFAPIESPTVFLSLVPAVLLLESLAGYVARLEPERASRALEATGRITQRLGLSRG